MNLKCLFCLEADGSNLIYVEDLDLSHIGTAIVPNSAFISYASLTRLNLGTTNIESNYDLLFIYFLINY